MKGYIVFVAIMGLALIAAIWLIAFTLLSVTDLMSTFTLLIYTAFVASFIALIGWAYTKSEPPVDRGPMRPRDGKTWKGLDRRADDK